MWAILLLIVGSQTPATTWSINGTVTLPIGPDSIAVKGGIEKEVMSKTQDDPVQVVDGKQALMVTLSGTIVDDSKTVAQLWADVITPLLELEGSEVTLICPIAGLNGNYLLDSFAPKSDKHRSIYEYTLTLSKASLNIIMQAGD
jgi:hypothetical protein